MRKTLIALIALSGVSMGATLARIDKADSNLKAYWNFDTSSNPTVSTVTWEELPTWNEAGYGESTEANKHPYTQNAGLKAKDGFTISFDIKGAESGTLLSMSSGSSMDLPWRNISISLTDAVVSAKFHGDSGDPITKNLTEGQLTSEWTTLTLVGSVGAQNSKRLVLDFYVNGAHIGTHTSSLDANAITGDNVINNVQFGHYGVSANSAPTNYDNILVYNRALSATEVKNLTIPEPTTATLSLLALAGLAARRRRK